MMGRMDDSAPRPDREPASPVLAPLPPVLRGGSRVPLLAAALAAGCAVVFWVVGHLPWVLDGFHVDPRPYGRGDTLSQLSLPIPLIASQLTALIAFTTVGAIGAMVLPLLFPAIPRPLGVVVSALSLVATAVAVTSIARVALADEPDTGFASDPRVLDGLVVGVLGLVVLCVVVGGLASFQVGFLPIAAAVVVTQLGSWLALLELPRPDLVAQWTTVALLGGAFLVSVRRRLGWIVVWPVALVIVWLGTPIGAATSVIGGRLRPGQNLDDSLGDVYDNGWEVFKIALWDEPRTWWPQVVAVAIGLVWLVVRQLRTAADR